MKKLFIFLLILAMVPVVALGEEQQDPIVGSWYMYYDINATPEIKDTFPNYVFMFGVYTFQSDSLIMLTENDISPDGEYHSVHSQIGKWSKTDDGYSYSMIGFGESTCRFEKEDLLLKIETEDSNTKSYMRLHRLLPFNPYKDYVFEK